MEWRDISNSSVERIIFPDSFHIISFISKELKNIIENIHIDYEKINSNLEIAQNKLISQRVLSFLVSQGIDRDSAYGEIQKALFANTSYDELLLKVKEKFNLDVPNFQIETIKNFDDENFQKN